MEDETFRNIVATFLFFALLNKKGKKKPQILTAAAAHDQLLQTIQNVSGSAENCLFWSQNQKILLDDEENCRLMKFDSQYGTGE